MKSPRSGDVTANPIAEQFTEVTTLLKELQEFYTIGEQPALGLESTLSSIATELRAARSIQFGNSLNAVESEILDDVVESRAENYAQYTLRREQLDQIAQAIKIYTQADLVTLYELSSDRRPKALPGKAGQFLDEDAMLTEMQPSDVVFQFAHLDAPQYIQNAQKHDILVSKREDTPNSDKPRFTFREKIASSVVVPVNYKNQPEGLLFLNYRELQAFGKGQRQDIEALAERLVLTLHNIRYYRQALENNQQLESLLRVVRDVTQKTEHQSQMLDTIIKGAVEIIGTSRGAIIEWDNQKKTGNIIAEHVTDSNLQRYKGLPFSTSSPLQQRVLAGEIVVVQNIDEHDNLTERERNRFKEGEIKSTVLVPVVDDEGQVIASIGIDETRYYNRQFSKTELRLCEILANQAAIALKLSDSLSELTDTNQSIQLQQTIMDAAIESTDPTEVYQMLLENGLELLQNADSGQLFFMDEKGDRLITIVSTNNTEIGLPYNVDDSVIGTAIQEERTIHLDNIEENPKYKGGYESDMLSELAVPLFDNNQIIGVLNAESKIQAGFSSRDVELWETLGKTLVKVINLTRTIGDLNALSLLNDTLREVIENEGQNQSEALQKILDVGKNLAKASIGQVLSVEGDELEIIQSTQEDIGQRVSIYESITGISVLTKETLNIKNLAEDEHPEYGAYGILHKWLSERDQELLSELAVPLVFGSEVIGVINFESASPHAFTEVHERLVERMAVRAAVIIKLSQLFELQQVSAQARDLSDILHRINNPLGLVQQYSKFAVKRIEQLGIQDETLQEDLAGIHEKSEEIANLARRLRNDLRDIETYPININNELTQSLNAFIDDSPSKHVEFQTQFGISLPLVRCGNKVSRVLYDLINNAVEALNDEPGEVSIITGMNGDAIEVQIQDTGEGIPPEELELIFEDWFFRPKKRSADVGRGLGLHWAKRFLNAYGADIFPHSIVGTGTTMTIRFKRWVD